MFDCLSIVWGGEKCKYRLLQSSLIALLSGTDGLKMYIRNKDAYYYKRRQKI